MVRCGHLSIVGTMTVPTQVRAYRTVQRWMEGSTRSAMSEWCVVLWCVVA